MFLIENNTNEKRIHITRGDVGTISISAQTKSGENYTFKKGDIIRLNVVRKNKYAEIVLTKSIEVIDETSQVDIPLSSVETTIGEIINKPKKYYYEIVLNPDTSDQTIIGHDEKGAKEFILYPEAKDYE